LDLQLKKLKKMSEIKRKLATIERISEIHPIEGADAIERAVVRGWNVVIKKGEYSVGDLVVYCEIDSVMPERPEFEFLRPRGFRIRTIKLRGQISQGIIFPLTVLDSCEGVVESHYPHHTTINGAFHDLQPGLDVTELLGVTKYDPPIPAELRGQVEGRFPSHSIKTDEERIENLRNIYDEYRKHRWVAAEKLDGSSCTFFIYEGKFGVTSRNLELKESETNSFWKVARQLNVEEKMRTYMKENGLEALTLQGELVGEGIQGNKYKLKGQNVYFFRAFDPIKYMFFSMQELEMILMSMDLADNMVPVVDIEYTLPENFDDLIKFADGRSALYDTAREGIVFVSKEANERYQGRLSFKVISRKFLLKHNA